MTLLDKPGALAKIATALGEAGISIDRMRQYGEAVAGAPKALIRDGNPATQTVHSLYTTCTPTQGFGAKVNAARGA
jgi:hypothetical protein